MTVKITTLRWLNRFAPHWSTEIVRRVIVGSLITGGLGVFAAAVAIINTANKPASSWLWILWLGVFLFVSGFIVAIPVDFWVVSKGRISRLWFSSQQARQERLWRKYHPIVTEGKIQTHYLVTAGTRHVQTCRLYLPLTMSAFYPDGETKLVLEASTIEVKQERAGSERAYTFHYMMDSNKGQTDVIVPRGGHYDYSADFVALNEGAETPHCPDLDKDFAWELRGLASQFTGPDLCHHTLPTLKGVHLGPK